MCKMILFALVPAFNRAELVSQSPPLLMKTLERSSLSVIELLLADNNSSHANPEIARNIDDPNKLSSVMFEVIRQILM